MSMSILAIVGFIYIFALLEKKKQMQYFKLNRTL